MSSTARLPTRGRFSRKVLGHPRFVGSGADWEAVHTHTQLARAQQEPCGCRCAHAMLTCPQAFSCHWSSSQLQASGWLYAWLSSWTCSANSLAFLFHGKVLGCLNSPRVTLLPRGDDVDNLKLWQLHSLSLLKLFWSCIYLGLLLTAHLPCQTFCSVQQAWSPEALPSKFHKTWKSFLSPHARSFLLDDPSFAQDNPKISSQRHPNYFYHQSLVCFGTTTAVNPQT